MNSPTFSGQCTPVHDLLRFILLDSFSDSLLVISISDIVYDWLWWS